MAGIRCQKARAGFAALLERVLVSAVVDFDDTPDEAAFRAEARSWLEAHAELRRADARPTMASANDPGHLEACRAWQRTLYDGGWTGLTWPKEFGGQVRPVQPPS